MNYLALIGQILGSAAADSASQMGRDKAMALIKSVQDEFGKIDVPKLKELFLEKQKETALNGIKDDPTYRSQQNAADAQLNDTINSGGLTLADRAALNAIRGKISRSESAGRNAIESGMAARGSLDSGAQLAMQLQGNQQAAQSLAQAGEQTAGAAQARAYQAIRDRGQNATAGLNRTYQMASDRARAEDAINAGNVAIANAGAKYNASIPQQNFNNQLQLAGAKANPTYNTSGAISANAKEDADRLQKLGNMGGQAAQSAYAEYKAGQSNNSANGSVQNLGQPNQGGQPGTDVVTVDVPKDFQEQEANYNTDGSSGDALIGQSSRPGRTKEIVGYDENGKPMYGYRTAS